MSRAVPHIQSNQSGSIDSSRLTVTAANTVTNTIHGGGIEGGLNVELIKNFRIIGTGYWASGGGRYIASTGGPELYYQARRNAFRNPLGVGDWRLRIPGKAKYDALRILQRSLLRAERGFGCNAAPTSGVGTCTVTTNFGYRFKLPVLGRHRHGCLPRCPGRFR